MGIPANGMFIFGERTETMSSKLLDNGLAVMEFARNNTLAFLEDVPEEKWGHQPAPNANHAMWIIGHLAVTDDYFLTNLAGRDSKLPADWSGLFGMGSQPQGDLSAYPSPSDVRDQLRPRREELFSWFKSLSEEKLIEPLTDDWKQFAPNYIGLASSLAWHEGLHAGQLTVVRKSLGIAPKFG